MPESEPLQPTLIYTAGTQPETLAVGADMSRAHVGFVAGSAPRFTDEIGGLLRERLKGAAYVLTIALCLSFFQTLSLPRLSLRLAILAVVAGTALLLRGKKPFNLHQLRMCELAIFGSVAVQGTVMPVESIRYMSAVGDPVGVAVITYFCLGAWSLLIVTYGLLIPNTWQRAVSIIVPASLVPYALFVGLWLSDERIRAMFAEQPFVAPMPLPLVAAMAGIYGAHAIHSMRRDAFKARQFGQYRLKEKLGAGGMGEVYQAEHELLKRPCAIKLIRPGANVDAEAVARFEREVQATAQLSHWNTIEIYDYGRTDDGIFYYVMELLRGLSLDDLIERHGALPAGRTVYLLRQVCNALHEAHGLGFIHRDLKPGNIFAARRGGNDDVAKLLDFGLVLHGAGGDDARITRQGYISGTPHYMSPEQATAGEHIDARSDIYSLGAVAYHLVTGQTVFEGRSVLDQIVAHARDPVVLPSLRREDVPADLEAVIVRCLEKKPEARYQTAAELEKALAACASAAQWNAEIAAAWWRAQANQPADRAAAASNTPTL